MVYLVKENRIGLIFSASIHVVQGNGEGVYLITADILCYSNTLYKVTMKVGEDEQAVDAVVKAIKKLVNGQVVIEKAGKAYNMNGIVIR